MNSMRRVAVVILALSVVSAGACRRKPAAVVPVPAGTATAQSNADSIARERARLDSIARANARRDSIDRARADSIRRANDAAAAAAGDAARLRDALLAVVYFEYDKADLRDDARANLDAKVAILKTNTAVTLRLAGHTDNRGSDEYNLALGQRRAAAAKQYMADRGIAESRLETITYGEERPRCQQEDESCYAQNRRAEFEITAGGNMLRRH
jgi:peptidoglycan-associated lipoprotein